MSKKTKREKESESDSESESEKNQNKKIKKAEDLKKQNILNDIKAKTEIIKNKNKPLISLEQINTNKNPNISDKNNNIMKKQMSDLDKNRINEQNKKNLDVQEELMAYFYF